MKLRHLSVQSEQWSVFVVVPALARPVRAGATVGRTAPVFLHVRPIQPGTGIPAGAKTGRADPRHATPAATSTAT